MKALLHLLIFLNSVVKPGENSDDALLCKVRLTSTLAFVSFKLSFKLLKIDLGDPTWV